MKKKSTNLFALALLFFSGSAFAQPSNNECAGAITLTQFSTCQNITGDVAGATQSQTGCSGEANNDVWYKFTNTSADFNIEVAGSASFDVVVEVFTGTCGNLTSMGCEDIYTNGSELLEGEYAPIGTYYLRVYDYASGTPATTNFDICLYGTTPTSIVENAKSALSVYPNPARDQVRVDFGKTINNSTVNVYNMLGVLTHTQTVNQVTFVECQLPEAKGAYFIHLVNADGTTSSTKVIKE
jgi:hypothetical protein